MATIIIAFKLLWKRMFANIVLIIQILVSIIMLSQVYVTIIDYKDNIKAVNELPTYNTVVITVFNYYTLENVIQQINQIPQVKSIGRVYMSNDITLCNNVACNLTAYNDSIISHYLPDLYDGSWLSDFTKSNSSLIPAVVSSDIGLDIYDQEEITLSDGSKYNISVVGILSTPTQYLYPCGSASPKYFAASSIINQNPVIIVNNKDLEYTDIFKASSDMPSTSNIFVFLEPNISKEIFNSLLKKFSKYGETTPMASLVFTFNKNTNEMIGAASIMFIIFVLLAVTGVLSNNVIQSLRNRRQFTVYYLLGMNWKKGAKIEICRVSILITITMMLSLLLGKSGLLMLEWMTHKRAVIFYGLVFLYIVIMFIIVGAGFLVKLIREDLSASLKDLQQGE